MIIIFNKNADFYNFATMLLLFDFGVILGLFPLLLLCYFGSVVFSPGWWGILATLNF